MKIIDLMFGQRSDEPEIQPSTEKVVIKEVVPQTTEEHSVAPQKMYPGWKLDLTYYRIDTEHIHHFIIQHDANESFDISDQIRQNLKNIVINVHSQLNNCPDEGFLNIENSLLIKKEQFVGLVVSTI